MSESTPLRERIETLVGHFPNQRIVAIGDVMLDQYRRGHATGLSPEAPVIDLLNPTLEERPGGAANVAWNVGRLGAGVTLLGVVGSDPEAASLQKLLGETPGITFVPVGDSTRPTTLKLRFYHEQFQVLRVSQESREPVSADIARQCRDLLFQHTETADAVAVEDYGKGVVGPHLIAALKELRQKNPALPIVFDPKVGNEHVYEKGMCTVLKPNWKEACHLTGMPMDTTDREDVARMLSEKYDCSVLVTLGGDGTIFYNSLNGKSTLIPTRTHEAFDIAGAGDTACAAATLAMAGGASLFDAAILANLAAGIAVQKSGTAYVTPEELKEELQHSETEVLLKQIEKIQSDELGESRNQ